MYTIYFLLSQIYDTVIVKNLQNLQTYFSRNASRYYTLIMMQH